MKNIINTKSKIKFENTRVKTFFKFSTLFLLMVVSLNVSAQTDGGRTGTAKDGYVINDDNSNYWSFLRLQTSDYAWRLNNFNNFTITRSNSADHGDYGEEYFKINYPNGSISLEKSKNTYKGLEWFYGDSDRYGISQAPGGNMALYTASSFGNSFISFNLSSSATSFQELMRIAHNGNVGIGTTSPSEKLHVNGTGRFTGLKVDNNAVINNTFIGDVGHGPMWMGIAHKDVVNTSSYGLLQNNNGAYTFLNINPYGNGYIGFRVGNADKAVILSNGNMGIGTTSPTSKLAVKGTVTALDYALVTAANMPDYVFNSNYKLLDLKEVENFIKINKHLPNFKSAKEMEANGYSLQDMDKGLLQTIEEMTLHSISQEKKIEQQSIQLQKLENELYKIKALLNPKN